MLVVQCVKICINRMQKQSSNHAQLSSIIQTKCLNLKSMENVVLLQNDYVNARSVAIAFAIER